MNIVMRVLCLGVLLVPLAALASDPPELGALTTRVQAVASNAVPYERLQAQQAIEAYAGAPGRARDAALAVAELRVETLEIAARTADMRQQIERLDRERTELLIEASRQDAARARAETERLRIQAQIQAEEAARALNAQLEAEAVLEGVSSEQAERLRAARQRAAELQRLEAELLRSE